MHRVVASVVGAVAVLVGLTATAAQQAPKVVTGEMIALNCYLREDPRTIESQTYKDCAEANARTGQPLAILSGEDFYIIKGDWTRNNNQRLLEFLAARVEATGEVADVNGKKFITIVDVRAATPE
jgi:hypothetical protein